MKFTKEKVASLSGGVEWRFTEESTAESGDPFVIVADQTGIRFVGRSPTVMDMVHLQELAKIISDAWTAHRKLRPNLALNAAGH